MNGKAIFPAVLIAAVSVAGVAGSGDNATNPPKGASDETSYFEISGNLSMMKRGR